MINAKLFPRLSMILTHTTINIPLVDSRYPEAEAFEGVKHGF